MADERLKSADESARVSERCHVHRVSHGSAIVEGPAPAALLASLAMDPGLDRFRQPREQQKALIEIAGFEEGSIYIAHKDGVLVGYVTFHPPDELERWGQVKLPGLLELGAIEVAPGWRRAGIGYALLRLAFAGDYMEDYIVIATEYCWHWDLKGTGLSVWEYQKVLQKVMGSVGLEPRATDDPEITSHAANMLMVRIGSRVPFETVTRFEAMRYQNRWVF